MNRKNINLFSKKESFDKILRKNDSQGSMMIAFSAIHCFEKFSLESNSKSLEKSMNEIQMNIEENHNDVSTMIFLDKFSSFLQKKSKSSSTINIHVSFSKKYLRQCGRIRISSDDMQDHYNPN